MLARGSSPLRGDSPASTAIPLTSTTIYNHTQSKKRKRDIAPNGTASPAPSEPLNPAENVVLPSSHDSLALRPRLNISRGPVFIPISEGSPYHLTEQLATNRIGFRYIPAGVTPHGSSISFRTIESNPTSFRVGWEDRSPCIKVTQDGLGLLGDRGFRSARCNAPIREGKWYMEVKIEHGGGAQTADSARREGAHVRLGWGRREASLNGPCGLDGYSYGIRDKTGEKVTLSRARPYCQPFGTGDVVGMYISLPPLRKPIKNDPHDPAHIKRERIAIEFKGQEYFESLEYPQSKEMIALMDFQRKAPDAAPVPSSNKKSATVKNVPERGRGAHTAPEPAPLRPLPTLTGSTIAFFVNGQSVGPAFRDIYDFRPLRAPAESRKRERKRAREGAREHKENPFDDGTLGYYPFISLFNEARVRINPGPNFDFSPPPDIDTAFEPNQDAASEATRTWRPVCERYQEFMEEQWALDRLEEEEARVDAESRAEEERLEAEKKSQREHKRALANARKRAKQEAEAAAAANSAAATSLPEAPRLDTLPKREGSTAPMLSGPGVPAYIYEPPMLDLMQRTIGGSNPSHVNSPAPTVASSVDAGGVQSGYNSEYGDIEASREEEEEEEIPAEYLDVPATYGAPVGMQHYRYRAAAIPMEEEES
ncbi:hypothetical protein DENSPDRAFT_104891 [Dentipellis sp. KUC8613]|nr:hypothetical protein DENSPDRAFT_104891 [Dentipellis sp. KUC8613]